MPEPEIHGEATKELLRKRVESRSEMMDEAVGFISSGDKGGGGTLNKISTVADDMLQNLLMGNYISPEEGDDISAAIDESLRYGCEVDSIMRWVIIQCGVSKDHKSVREWAVQAMTHLDVGAMNTQKPQSGWRRNRGPAEKPV